MEPKLGKIVLLFRLTSQPVNTILETTKVLKISVLLGTCVIKKSAYINSNAQLRSAFQIVSVILK